ncbi:MAG: helix-turn-helix domain-containing protein [Planctomycetales bacterium]|nr:helix-turn-helix domain-containing protein [Planctomycetales bacterium]
MQSHNANVVPAAAALITVAELANLLGVSVRTVWRKESTGYLPHPVRIGGLVRWRRNEIMQWIEDGCPKPGKQ